MNFYSTHFAGAECCVFDEDKNGTVKPAMEPGDGHRRRVQRAKIMYRQVYEKFELYNKLSRTRPTVPTPAC